jgi:uncharacterized membrane protein YcjF (UPF0283 family)
MDWKTTATVIALSPLAGLWTAFAIYETARVLVVIRAKGGRRNGR